MELASPHKAPERLLAFGGAGSGKTTNYFHVANGTPEEVNFYVIDTDQTVLPFIESDEFEHLEPRFNTIEPIDWPEYISFLKEATAKAKKKARRHWTRRRSDDWLVIDMVSEPWDEVQRYFSDKVYGADIGDFWLEYQKRQEEGDSKGSKSAFDGMTDWQTIKKLYKEFKNLVTRFPGHVYLATGEKKVNAHVENSATKRDFGKGGDSKGFKPDGEKTLGHMTRTVLRMHNFRYTTIKDRQREQQGGAKVEDFSKDYLLKVAGWKPAGSVGKEAA